MSTEPTPAEVPQWAKIEDVYSTAGPIGARLRVRVEEDPEGPNAEAQLAAARTEAATRLHRVYGKTLPEFTGTGLEVVRWAVARLAAANLLDVLGMTIGSGDAAAGPERLRRTAWATLDDGVPGWPRGDGSGPDGPTFTSAPRVSSTMTGSAFEDPYEPPVRGAVYPWQA